MKAKIKEFKEAQRTLFIDFFNSEILPLLNDEHIIYYGMGAISVESVNGGKNEDLTQTISDTLAVLFNEIEYNREYRDHEYLCTLDIDTNKHEQGKPLYKCSAINIRLYKYELSEY